MKVVEGRRKEKAVGRSRRRKQSRGRGCRGGKRMKRESEESILDEEEGMKACEDEGMQGKG